MRLLYSALYYCLMPCIVLRMLWRSRLAPAYRQRWSERLGYFRGLPDDGVPAIWVHAVSVGETIAAAPLVESMLQQFPDYRVVLTTTTPTGSERARALFGDRVLHVYAPWDLPGSLRRFLDRTRPRLLIIMETELWPNMLHYTRASGCNVMLANGRMSQRSARGYARVAGLTRQLLSSLNVVACQTLEDSKRFLALGVAPAVLHVTGSVKFDVTLDESLRNQAAELRRTFMVGGRPVLVAASTHPGEEALVLAAFRDIRRTRSDCLLVLVPRHPERFEKVHGLCVREGWQVVRRSSDSEPSGADDILLGDTMGELLLLLGTATVAVVGGSLLAHGGHNVLEAAVWGVPAVSGPHMENFAEVSARLEAAGAVIRLDTPGALSDTLQRLLDDADLRQRMGMAGLQVLDENRGASARLLALVQRQLALS